MRVVVGIALLLVACSSGGGAGTAAGGSAGLGAGTGGTGGSGGSSGIAGSGGGKPAVCTGRTGTPAPLLDPPIVRSITLAGVAPNTYTDYVAGDVATSGDWVVVGLPLVSPQDPSIHASALVFHFDGSDFVFDTELLPAEPANLSGSYGRFVEISRSANTVIVSDTQHGFVFTHGPTGWSPGVELTPADLPELLAGVAVTDDRAVLGYYGSQPKNVAGKAVVFRSENGAWVEEQDVGDDRLIGSDGNPVTIEADRFVVANRKGTGIVYARNGTTWSETQQLSAGRDPDLAGNRLFFHGGKGVSVFELEGDNGFVRCDSMSCNDQCDGALLGDFFVTAGAPAYSVGGDGALYRFDGNQWVQDWKPSYEARAADIGTRFAALLQEGFVAAPLEMVQFAP